MARDQVALMRHFGFERFSVAGHDRGGRFAYRLALDHPERVEKLAVLDILPTSSTTGAPKWASPWAIGTGSSCRSPIRFPKS